METSKETLKMKKKQIINNDIYKMKLHDRVWLGFDILRVPGGWIYSDYNNETDTMYNSIFIPYNNEFQHND